MDMLEKDNSQRCPFRKKGTRRWLLPAFLFFLFLGIFTAGTNVHAQEDSEKGEVILPVEFSGMYFHDEAFKALKEMNKRREKAGRDALGMDAGLFQAAQERAAELALSYGNIRPDDTDCQTAYSGLYEREYIEIYLEGATSAAAAMKEWEKSFHVKTEMENRDYQSAGIACFRQNGNYYWIAVFSDKSADAAEQPKNETRTVTVAAKRYLLAAQYLSPVTDASISIGSTMTGTLVLKNFRNNHCSASLVPSSLEFLSSDASVACVDKNGVITGISTGSAVITARLKVEPSVGASLIVSVAPKTIDIGEAKIATSPSAFYYSGKPKRPEVVITYGGISLKKGKDFTVNYRNNVQAGEADVHIIGYGAYSGKVTVHFPIKKLNLEKADFSLDRTSYYCTGEEIRPEVRLKFAGVTLKEGTDYTVSVTDNVKTGVGKLYVEGIGNCEGSLDRDFEIKKSSWNVETGELIVATSSGLIITPELRVTDSFAPPKSITVQSDNEKVAKGTKDGRIKTVGAGSATLKLLLPNTNEKNPKTLKVKLVVRPDKVKLQKVEKKGSNTLQIQWKKVSGASGYVIEYARKKDFKKYHLYIVRDAEKAAVQLKTLEKSGSFWVRMRAYVLFEGDRYYGENSKARKSS